MLYRLRMVCMEGDYHSLVNIRLPLEAYQFKKSLRRIMRKNARRFRVEIGHAHLTKEKERLYQQHRHRFRGFVFDSLLAFLKADVREDIFDTYEVCVYDGDRLVAVSFFDMGQLSIASLIGLFVQDEAYKAHSLGIYTMLLEVDYAMACGKRFYYPGYVLDRDSELDYKLRLGDYEFYDWKGHWRPMNRFRQDLLPAYRLHQRMNRMKEALRSRGIPYKQWLYPLFSLSYLENLEEELVKSVVFIACFPRNTENPLIIEYALREEAYLLSRVATREEYLAMIETSVSEEFSDPDTYWMGVLAYEQHYPILEDASQMADMVLDMHGT